MFQQRMGRRAAFWGGELFVHRCAIARHSLLVVGQGYWLQPFAAWREDRGTASLSAPAVFCIALCAIARHSRAGKKNGSRQGQRLPGAMLPFRFLTP